jgi:predicted helicase
MNLKKPGSPEVPPLALIEQTLPVWLRELSALSQSQRLRWICVNETVTNNAYTTIIHTQDYRILARQRSMQSCVAECYQEGKKRITFTTYQSGRTLAEAMRTAGVNVDLAIMDEAEGAQFLKSVICCTAIGPQYAKASSISTIQS